MAARKNTSRSKELDIVKHAFKNNLPAVKKYLKNNPRGGKLVDNDVVFEYGNIERLIPDMNWDIIPDNSLGEDAQHIYHLDGLGKDRKEEIENNYNLQKGILSGKCKADLLIIKLLGIDIVSYKDSSKIAKLGQVSASIVYNNVQLQGGLIFPIPEIDNAQITHNDTDLSPEQFEKLGNKDIKLAYFKKLDPATWNNYVQNCLDNAKLQLIKFSKVIQENKYSFISFISKTIYGQEQIPDNIKLIMNNYVIGSETVKYFFENCNYKILTHDHFTQNKFSLIVQIEINNKIYGITKIEPAFDGAKSNVSQTKGIIFYFQQYPAKGLHIWQLLKDIPQYIV